MTLSDIVDSLLLFVSRWAGTTAPRLLTAFIGILVCILVVVARWDRRLRLLGASLGIALGMLLVAMAVDTRVLHYLADTSHIARIRILLSLVSFSVLVVTIEAIRRSHLQERYALLWVATALIILVTAFFPQLLDLIGFLFGVQFVTSVVGILFVFLLLIAFHVSIAMSGFQQNQSRIAQRCALLEQRLEEMGARLVLSTAGEAAPLPQSPSYPPGLAGNFANRRGDLPPAATTFPPHRFRGSQVAAPLIILLAAAAVFGVGMLAPQAMIGDEVTHYYMLVRQSDDLSHPNFFADIPTGWGTVETRRYPHSFIWHYLGALVYAVTGGSFPAVQAYQTGFWIQLLAVAYLLARSRQGIQTRSAILYMLTIASLPMGLIFSVAFYQDVPMAAQVLTAFYLLKRGNWLPAAGFLAFAIGLKFTALLFVPAFLGLQLVWSLSVGTRLRAVFRTAVSALILLMVTIALGIAVERYAGERFYPYQVIKRTGEAVQQLFSPPPQTASFSQQPPTEARVPPPSVTAYEAIIIANHPGDLRIKENYVVYGGIILWLVVIAGLLGGLCCLVPKRFATCPLPQPPSATWLWAAVGLPFLLASAWLLQSAPDARFFLPGIPFILLPLVERTVRWPRPKLIISLVAALAIMQGGYVLSKTYRLRNVSAEIQEAVLFLQKESPEPNRIFMYPEGNYRIFPSPHEWYLNYRLREFWRSDNSARIEILHRNKIGAVVIKKHLIAEVDPKITNLGVYPTGFVQDLANDPRFFKLFENAGVTIYRVPWK